MPSDRASSWFRLSWRDSVQQSRQLVTESRVHLDHSWGSLPQTPFHIEECKQLINTFSPDGPEEPHRSCGHRVMAMYTTL